MASLSIRQSARQFCFSLLFLLFTSVFAYPQAVIVLRGGKKIECTKVKVQSDFLIAKNKGRNSKFPVENVLGFYYENENWFYFQKKIKTDDGFQTHFVRKVLQGKINLYAKYDTTYTWKTMPTTIGPSGYVYSYNSLVLLIEKQGDPEEIFKDREKPKDRKEMLDRLRYYVSDNPVITDSLLTKKKITQDDLIAKIRQYNYLEYEPPIVEPNHKLGKVVIYRSGSGKDKLTEEPISVMVNDSTYSLQSYGWVKFTIPVDVPVKVCFKFKDIYEIITSSEYLTTFYEFIVDPKANGFKLEDRDKETALNRIDYMREFRARSNNKK